MSPPGDQLPNRLDEDAPSVLNVDAQVVAVQQPHTHQGDAVCFVGLDMSWQAVPEHRNAINVEFHYASVG